VRKLTKIIGRLGKEPGSFRETLCRRVHVSDTA
jgi:hypothetical protein